MKKIYEIVENGSRENIAMQFCDIFVRYISHILINKD